MSDPTTSNSLLEQQLAQLSQLEDILLQETEVLKQHSPEALTKVTQLKNQLLADIQSLDQTFGTSPQFLQQKATGELDGMLNQIEESLSRCKELNSINGQIIAQSQLAIERMKSSLLDNQDKSSMTYNAKGKKHVGLSSLGIKA